MKHICCNINFENIKNSQSLIGPIQNQDSQTVFCPKLVRLGVAYKSQNNDKIHNYTQYNKIFVLIYFLFQN